MDIETIKNALGIADADDVQVLERIQELRAAAGETFDVEPAELALIRAGEHEQVALNADGSATVTLLEPLTLGKDQLTELTMRRPKLKDLRRAEEMAKGSPLARMSTMIQLLSGQAQKLIDELSSHDANVAGLVAAFLGERRPRTGATS